jgi:hypothetical protein
MNPLSAALPRREPMPAVTASESPAKSAEPSAIDAAVLDAPADVASRDANDAALRDVSVAVAVEAGAAEAAAETGIAVELPAVDEGDGGDGTDLGATLGYLIVRSSVSADVWASGVKLGPTNRKNAAPCGLRFVRISKGDPPSWLNEGRTVDVKCQTVTTSSQEPKPAR